MHKNCLIRSCRIPERQIENTIPRNMSLVSFYSRVDQPDRGGEESRKLYLLFKRILGNDKVSAYEYRRGRLFRTATYVEYMAAYVELYDRTVVEAERFHFITVIIICLPQYPWTYSLLGGGSRKRSSFLVPCYGLCSGGMFARLLVQPSGYELKMCVWHLNIYPI